MANTVLSFMIVYLFGGPKLLYKMLPVKELDAAFLYQQTELILELTKWAGVTVKAIICDGNCVNQAFFKKLNTNTSSPWQTKDNVFLLYDFVHLLKNIRNNWITEPIKELKFFVDEDEKVAKWTDRENLYKLESQHLIETSKLSEVAVYPSLIERQKVSVFKSFL